MDENKIQILLAIHHELLPSANLSEYQRPYSVQARLETIQKLIMEEIESKPKAKTEDDDSPF